MSLLTACVLQIAPAHHPAAWAGSLNDAGLNILGIPWWVWLIGAAILVGIAIAAATGLLELGAPALLEGLELDTEAAIADEELAAQVRLQNEIASNVNLLDGEQNCSWVADEVDNALGDTFAGRPTDPYAPPWFTPNMADGASTEIDEAIGETIDRLGPRTPQLADMANPEAIGSFEQSSMEQIAEQLQADGNGARGLVRIYDGAGNAHRFNAVNYGGKVFFIDGQEGTVWTRTDVLAGDWLGTNPNVEFLQTAGF